MMGVNCVLHATASEDAFFGTLDLTDFHLGSPMPAPEFIIVHTALFSDQLLVDLNMTPHVQKDEAGKDFFYARVDKTMPGFLQAGLRACEHVTSLLLKHGYYQTQPCMFTHNTDPTFFALVVDDYGVKHTDRVHFDRLVACSSQKCHVKAHPIASSFLGMTIAHDRTARTITTSVPNYIPNLLARHRPDGCKLYDSPSTCTPPSHGKSTPQLPATDDSPPSSPAQTLELQQVIGSSLCCARCNDLTMLEAVARLASLQSHPTVNLMKSLDRLVGRVAKHPNHCRAIRPSNMLLQCHSDASYLPLPNSGSKAGGYIALGYHTPNFLNSPLHCTSTIIPVVVASAGEAELAALFANVQIPIMLRSMLANLGYPQPYTPVWCDNEFVKGTCESPVRPKKSKSMDVRFNWCRQRASNGIFTVPFIPSLANHADFFTKSLSAMRHLEMVPLFVTSPTKPLLSAPFQSTPFFLPSIFYTSSSEARQDGSCSQQEFVLPLLPPFLPLLLLFRSLHFPLIH
jgi:hypothetical protein